MAWNRKAFTADTSFAAPPGVKEVVLFGYGGGGGGGGGGSSNDGGAQRTCGGSGGAGATPAWARVAVTPGSVYAVDIGAGGGGGNGAAANGTNGSAGVDGSNTTFGSSLVSFVGGGQGFGGKYNGAPSSDEFTRASRSNRYVEDPVAGDFPEAYPANFGDGGCGANSSSSGWSVARVQGQPCNGGCPTRAASGSRGTDATYNGGGPGGGGGGGYATAGGNGGNGGVGATGGGSGEIGAVGSTAAANSGAGGGGGGGGGGAATGSGNAGLGGAGGTGGSGLLVVYWWT